MSIISTWTAKTELNIELQGSRLVHLNGNNEPDLMVATRASGACSGIELVSSKIHLHKWGGGRKAAARQVTAGV